ncbi:MAG: sulfite exporter TauE/SafE family protein [Bacteroidales bacterium]|nr:sulfite exporter TauE/SafE family protein [Bacteroidales bacterium]
MSINELIILIVIGFLAGIVGGSLGLGGGIIIVPALVFILGLTQHQAQGTSLAVLLFPIGILGVINYTKNGYVNFKFAIVLMIAFILGSYLGSIISINLPAKTLRKIFGIFMLLISLKMILDK